MFNRQFNQPYMGVGPAMGMGMGVTPGANVMGTFAGKITPGFAPVAPAPYVPTAPVGPVPYSPTNVLPTTVAPPQVSPTQQFLNTNVANTVVPHVHPSHTTTVNKHVFTHKHYFPHTQSVINQCCSQHLVCPGPGPIPMPINPCCPPRPFGF